VFKVERLLGLVLTLDAEARILAINAKAAALFGASSESLVGRDWIQLSLPDRQEEHRRAYLMVIRRQVASSGFFESEVRRFDGSVVKVWWQTFPLGGEGGAPLEGLFCVGKLCSEVGVTILDEVEARIQARTAELVLAQQGLQQEIQRRRQVEEQLQIYKEMVERSPLTACVMDLVDEADPGSFTVQLANGALGRLSGVEASSLAGTRISEVAPGLLRSGRVEAWMRVLREQVAMDLGELEISSGVLARDPPTHWVHSRAFPLGPRRIGIVSEDISLRKAAERALARSTAELARSNADLERFAYFASHDLQEPMRKVQAFSERLERSLGPEPSEAVLDNLQRIRRACASMRGLVQALLEFSRVGGKVGALQAVDLGQSVQQALGFLQDRIVAQQAEVTMGPLPVVWAHPALMVQLFQNLLGNALKYHQPGEVPRVELRASSEGGRHVIEVMDQGIGVEEAQRERIFEPFYRLHPRSKIEGSGMGLAICRRIAEVHGGAVSCEAGPGGGCTFRLTLPARAPLEPR
jgi:PAS domain S-box-containing protein